MTIQGSSIDRRTIEEATRWVLRRTDPDISEYQVRMAVSRKVGILLLNPTYKAIVCEAMYSFNRKERNRDVFSCDLSGKAQVLVQHIGNDPPHAILWIRKFKHTDAERRGHPYEEISITREQGNLPSRKVSLFNGDADRLCHPSEEISITSEEWMLLKRNVASIDRAARKAAHSLRKWGEA